jgi:hypothetical protein
VNPIVVTAAVAVLSAFVGGGVWSFASAWLGQRFSKEEKEIDRVRADLKTVQERHDGCEDRVATLERRLEAVEHHHASLVPRWIKDANKRICWINGAALLAIFAPLWARGATRSRGIPSPSCSTWRRRGRSTGWTGRR